MTRAHRRGYVENAGVRGALQTPMYLKRKLSSPNHSRQLPLVRTVLARPHQQGAEVLQQRAG